MGTQPLPRSHDSRYCNAHVDVQSQACFGDLALGHCQQIRGRDMNVVALDVDLVGVFMCSLKIALAMGTSPGCATQVPS